VNYQSAAFKGKGNETFGSEGLGGSQSILVNIISVNIIDIKFAVSLEA
jgi:hypothetical protein